MATTNYNGKSIQELAAYTDSIRITHADLTAAATTQTITKTVKAGQQVRGVAFKVHTAFDGGATSALKLDVGDGVDADGYIDNEEIHADATEVLFGPALDGLLTGKTYAADDTIDILFTATGANVSVLDAGEVEIVFNIINLNEVSAGFAG
tara:strand:+ start:118 stop:570 length:453 start_codon:yes stop_codon:yes gene_type:complete